MERRQHTVEEEYQRQFMVDRFERRKKWKKKNVRLKLKKNLIFGKAVKRTEIGLDSNYLTFTPSISKYSKPTSRENVFLTPC